MGVKEEFVSWHRISPLGRWRVQKTVEILRVVVSARGIAETQTHIAQIGTDAAVTNEHRLFTDVVASVAAARAPLALDISSETFMTYLLGVARNAAKILINQTTLVRDAGERLRIKRFFHGI